MRYFAKINRDGACADFYRDPCAIVMEKRDMKGATGSRARRRRCPLQAEIAEVASLEPIDHVIVIGCPFGLTAPVGGRSRLREPAPSARIAHLKVVSFANGAGLNAGAAVGAAASIEDFAFNG